MVLSFLRSELHKNLQATELFYKTPMLRHYDPVWNTSCGHPGRVHRRCLPSRRRQRQPQSPSGLRPSIPAPCGSHVTELKDAPRSCPTRAGTCYTKAALAHRARDEQTTPRCKASRGEPRPLCWTGALWLPHPRGCAPKSRPVSKSQNGLSWTEPTRIIESISWPWFCTGHL